MVTAGRLYGRRAAGGSGCCWGSVYYDFEGGRLCASGLLLTLSPSPLSHSALLGCLAAAGWNAGTGSGWAASGRSSAALRLGRAGRLQAAGVGAGVFFASASLPLSPCVLCCWPCLCPSGRIAVCAHAGQGLRVLGCPLWLCLCWGTVASWARLSGVMLGGRSGRRAHGKIHKYKAVSLAIFHPLKYLNDEQNR